MRTGCKPEKRQEMQAKKPSCLIVIKESDSYDKCK
jgi:hypothetical protein